MEYCKQE